MGFSFFEEFAYGGGEDATIVSTVGRLISVPAHMTFNMVMAEFLGRAKFSKLSGKGSVILNYVLALLVPIIIHTLYDVCTAFNSSLMRGEVSGLVRALIGYAALLVYELVVSLQEEDRNVLRYEHFGGRGGIRLTHSGVLRITERIFFDNFQFIYDRSNLNFAG